MSSRLILRIIFGINDGKERIEGPLYLATKTMLANYEKSNPDSEILGDTLYHFCYETSPKEDIVTARNNDEKLESRLKEKWNDNINVLSGFLLDCKDLDTKIFFTSLIVKFKEMKEEDEENTQREMMEFAEAASVLKFVPTTNVEDRSTYYTVYVLKHSSFTRAYTNGDQFEIFPVKYDAHHPMFDFRHSIFKSLKETQDILIKHATDYLPCDRIKQIETPQNVARRTKHPFIVIEGLDGVGKSTLVKNLTERLEAPKFRNPPDSISEYREEMAKQCQPLCRAYYSLGNYLVAEEIKKTLETRPVVLDRFWHSTAAYAIAFEAKCGGENVIPAEGHPIYQWPNDLLKPSAVIFLKLSEDERKRRMQKRDETKTKEESHLKRSTLLRKRLIGAYKNMENPSCIFIDASECEKQVCDKVCDILELKDFIEN